MFWVAVVKDCVFGGSYFTDGEKWRGGDGVDRIPKYADRQNQGIQTPVIYIQVIYNLLLSSSTSARQPEAVNVPDFYFKLAAAD